MLQAGNGMPTTPLLMIPGPVEVSPAVTRAMSVPPPGHQAPGLIEAFGQALQDCRTVFKADADAAAYIVAGSGTLAMEMAASNILQSGDRAVVANTGYFSGRMAEIARRCGAEVTLIDATPGDAPSLEAIERHIATVSTRGSVKALFATHVDTSTGVRLDPEPLAALARQHDVLSVFDGVCATGGEHFDMAAWGADIYLTGSQKALSAPAGAALLVAGPRALKARQSLRQPPPLYLDWTSWDPIMKAYHENRPSYFATPATNCVLGLAQGLREIVSDTYEDLNGVDARVARHHTASTALRQAWAVMGLEEIPVRSELRATTLSALRYPAGVDAGLLAQLRQRGLVVAGGLHPALKTQYFRVGHMGYVTTQPHLLEQTVTVLAEGLTAAGHRVDSKAAVDAFRQGVN